MSICFKSPILCDYQKQRFINRAFIFISTMFMVGCVRPDQATWQAPIAETRLKTPGMSMRLDDQDIQRAFGATSKIEIELWKAIFNRKWETDREIVVIVRFPESWNIESKCITYFPAASNVEPILYIVNTGGQNPKCWIWEKLDPITRSGDGVKFVNRQIDILLYEDTKGWIPQTKRDGR